MPKLLVEGVREAGGVTPRKEVIGDAELWLGDCRTVLPMLGPVDAVVTDPPYGLSDKWTGGKRDWPLHHGQMQWDAETLPVVIELLVALNLPTIIWGGHLYPLSPQRGWLLWDKKQGDSFTSGHAELAWSNLDQPIRAFRMSQVEAYCNPDDTKTHPTQKPIGLMMWCLNFLSGASVLDPFMGSGTTGVACARLGRRFIGIEIHEPYFNIACRRIEQAQRQSDLFVSRPAPKSAVTADLFAAPPAADPSDDRMAERWREPESGK